MDLNNIYTQLILEHSRNPANKREVENPTYEELGHNPSCGDEITLGIRLNDDDIIEDIGFTGTGCAISQASTSIMADQVRGKTKEEAIEMADAFIGMIRGEEVSDEMYDELGDALAFENIQTMPARVKCAVLAWYTLKNVLENGASEGSFSLE